MDVGMIAVAFVFGFAASMVRLPPLVGYLIAGFVLHAFDYETTEGIEYIADTGILLLLFGIGLKLKPSTLARPVIWGGATIHAGLTTLAVGGLLLGVGALGVPLAAELGGREAVLVGFAFSFCSTVFAVKALEGRNETSALQGRLAIGTLVVQDIFAVVFLTLAVDEAPSPWALVVVPAILLARPLYSWVLDHAGHGELMLLLGLVLAVGVGGQVFEEVGLKPDLGALLIGLTLANHPRSKELASTLLGFKDILLIGFFLSIGLGGIPDGAALTIAVIVLAVLPIKTAGFVYLISRFRYRVRTAWHTSASLATYSEFGLIVAVVGVDQALLDERWVSAIAIAVSISFVLAAPLNTHRYTLYGHVSGRLPSIGRTPVRADDAVIDPGGAQIIVFGMGRIGAGAYDELRERRGDVVLGVDRHDHNVEAHRAQGRDVVRGDALDIEFWERLCLTTDTDLVVLAMSDHTANMEAVRRVRDFLPDATLAAVATHVDELHELEAVGVDVARNLYGEAGQGLAGDACDFLADDEGNSDE